MVAMTIAITRRTAMSPGPADPAVDLAASARELVEQSLDALVTPCGRHCHPDPRQEKACEERERAREQHPQG